jgi:hypothetical protein
MDSTALWAAQLAEVAPLPDLRLNKRLALILEAFASDPLGSIPQATGDWPAAKGAYRFLENPRVSDDLLLKGISRHTAEDARAFPELLIVQDTTSGNFTRINSIAELGPIDTAGLARGLLIHSTLAVSNQGRVLGLLDVQRWVRPNSSQLKPDEKESGKWLYGIEQARQVLGEASQDKPLPRLIHVMDREGDCFDVMLAIDDAADSAIIRCAQNRRVQGPLGLAHDAVRAQPLLGIAWVDVPNRPGQSARRAEVELRSLQTVLLPDREKYPHGWQMVWTLVEVWERYPLPGAEPLHWLLWTREPAQTLEETLEVVAKYRCRWPIEDYHLTMKSGCQIERLQLESWETLQKALVLYAAVAARIVQLRDWARQEPEMPARRLLSEEECCVLRARCDPKKKVSGELTLAQAVLWIGRLGGHLNRKSDGMPGVRTLWKGLRDLALLVEGYRAARSLADASGSPLQESVRRARGRSEDP